MIFKTLLINHTEESESIGIDKVLVDQVVLSSGPVVVLSFELCKLEVGVGKGDSPSDGCVSEPTISSGVSSEMLLSGPSGYSKGKE